MPPRARKLGHRFFRKPAIELAPALLGKIIVHRIDGQELRSRIVETEAYAGPDDLACHSSKGLTKRTQTLFGPPGHAYVYLIYGMHELFNIVAWKLGGGQAVLIRAAEPLDGWKANLSGPGRFARAMRITRSLNNLDLTGDSLFLINDIAPPPTIIATARVGVDYAKHWKDAPLRFLVKGSKAVSRPWPTQLLMRLPLNSDSKIL